LSDIVGQSGKIFAVESSTRVARELISNVSSKRTNVIPIVEDARKPRSYFSIFDKMDLVYCDIAQPDQTTIAIDNCKIYLKEAKSMLIVIKTRSIDVTMSPKNVITQEIKKLENNSFEIKQKIDLDPFDKDHAMINAVFYPK
jgi:fibrillarin-like pre-rRNA processing protein